VSGDIVVLNSRRGPKRVVVTFPLPAKAWAQLAETLGDGVELVEIRSADGEEDAVLVPSTSRQLIAKLSNAFPQAAVIVVEVEDHDHGVRLGGQVMRTLDAGADGYYVARSMEQLAGVVEQAFATRTVTHQPAALAPAVDDELDSILDRLIRREAPAEQAEAAPRDRDR
jgi:DNA-binding NarL/FixJ family response regulator